MPGCSCEPTNLLRRARCRRCGPLNPWQHRGAPLRACPGPLLPGRSGPGGAGCGDVGRAGSVPGHSGLNQHGLGRSVPGYTRPPAACPRPFSWRTSFLGAKSASRRELAPRLTGFRDEVDFRHREKRFNTTPRPPNQPSASYSPSGRVVSVPSAAPRVYGRAS